jgi:hypothetical protein
MGPLDGVKIVDLSVMISGPLAAMMLADQGADVVKVESPGLGDIMRFLGSSKGGVTGIFANNNRGKRSLVVDLKKPVGLDVVKRLVADANAAAADRAINGTQQLVAARLLLARFNAGADVSKPNYSLSIFGTESFSSIRTTAAMNCWPRLVPRLTLGEIFLLPLRKTSS